MQTRALAGTLFALAAGLLWGLVFVAPVLLPDYPAVMLSMARYLAFGLIALPLAAWDRQGLARLSRADWVEAFKLSAVGNLLYYACLAGAIQRAGAPLPTMIIGTLPVVIAVVSNLAAGDRRLPWQRLLPSLLLLAAGIACVNQVEWGRLQAGAASGVPFGTYATGIALALGAVACWTWYPLRNAAWVQRHPEHRASTWATAQGLATLPLAAAGFGGFWAWSQATAQPLAMPLGPTPGLFLGLVFAIGLFASWLGTLCWNAASARLSATVSGQLIVFETLAALGLAWGLRGQWPDAPTWAGAALLVAGVVVALRRR